MSTPLELGSSGPDVTALQQALAAAGFDPGGSDGTFGPATKAAVSAFQASKQLTADGIVGDTTAAALGLIAMPAPVQAAPPEAAPAIPGFTTDVVAQMFPQTPVANIAKYLPNVLDALVAANLTDNDMVLMALGTIRAETECFEPICEGQSHYNTAPGGAPFALYDNLARLGNQGPPDGANFCGRGFVQLTGRYNYTHYAAEIGEDLVNQPELACDPVIASTLLARFLADREPAIRQALAANNYAKARSLVNGGVLGLDRFTAVFQIGAPLLP